MQKYIDPTIQLLFEQYDYHPSCLKEIQELLINEGVLKAFARLFQKNTELLRTLNYNVTKTRNFEKIQNAKGLYVMKLKKSDMNYRIIYTYRSGKLALLLCCFFERADSLEKYDKYIPIAEQRKKEMEDRYGK